MKADGTKNKLVLVVRADPVVDRCAAEVVRALLTFVDRLAEAQWWNLAWRILLAGSGQWKNVGGQLKVI